ncbi:MAG: hypothetical protein ABIG42_03335 [bacterium]
MKRTIILTVLTLATVIVFFSGCQLNPQGSKEKMAFNNFMQELKAAKMMDGQVGNVKYIGNAIEFDYTDASLDKEKLQEIMGYVITMYANNNNAAQTGVTALKAWGKVNGKKVLKVVYNAGPSHSVEELLKFEWLD